MLPTMWKIGLGDGKLSDSPTNRKPEPLMPTSQAFAYVNTRRYSSPVSSTPYRAHVIHNTDLSAVDHHLGRATYNEQQQNKRGGLRNIEEVKTVASSRWNPTPEQLYGLEEMYRSGTRTPSAIQIQQIALKLRRFGKIEGKNVFYWFQNHKARERQKRRRQQLLHSSSLTQPPLRVNTQSVQKTLGLRGTVVEIEQTKNRVTSSNCSTTSEESLSMPIAAVAAAKSTKTDEGIQLEMTEFQPKNSSSCSTTAPHVMKHMVELSFPHTTSNASSKGDETEYQTLDLFPISHRHYNRDDQTIEFRDLEARTSTNGCNTFTSVQYFEFLTQKEN